jgi:hypothetical protein
MDEQVELLRAIWNEMKALNGRIDATNAALQDGLGALRGGLHDEIGGFRSEFKEEFHGLRTDLKSEVRRNLERDRRLGTAVAELSLDVRELTGIVHAWRDEHRLDREDLRERVARLEIRVGLEPR